MMPGSATSLALPEMAAARTKAKETQTAEAGVPASSHCALHFPQPNPPSAARAPCRPRAAGGSFLAAGGTSSGKLTSGAAGGKVVTAAGKRVKTFVNPIDRYRAIW